jgi:hypothetical protein
VNTLAFQITLPILKMEVEDEIESILYIAREISGGL